ncbi:MAG: NUDIX domain-containing protein [Candidatus Nanohalobium sp.]
MSREEFKLAVGAVITYRGKILIGQKEDAEDRVIAGQWHLPGGFVEKGEDTEKAVKREVKEETGLESEIFQLVDVNFSGEVDIGPDDIYRIVYHVEAGSMNAEAMDDLQEVKWVEAENLEKELGELDNQHLEENEKLRKFFEKLEKAPTA